MCSFPAVSFYCCPALRLSAVFPASPQLSGGSVCPSAHAHQLCLSLSLQDAHPAGQLMHHDQRQLSSLSARPQPLLQKPASRSRPDEACAQPSGRLRQTQTEAGHPLHHRGNASWWLWKQRIMGRHCPWLFFFFFFSSHLRLQTSQPS